MANGFRYRSGMGLSAMSFRIWDYRDIHMACRDTSRVII